MPLRFTIATCAVVGLMKGADTWDQLMRMMNRAFPVRGDSLQLDLFDRDD